MAAWFGCQELFLTCHLPNAITAHPTTTKAVTLKDLQRITLTDKKDYQGGTV
jgi:hypothetical protein